MYITPKCKHLELQQNQITVGYEQSNQCHEPIAKQ
jgi:hypothetical protein